MKAVTAGRALLFFGVGDAAKGYPATMKRLLFLAGFKEAQSMVIIANIFGGSQPGTASRNFSDVGSSVFDIFSGLMPFMVACLLGSATIRTIEGPLNPYPRTRKHTAQTRSGQRGRVRLVISWNQRLAPKLNKGRLG